MPLPAYRLPVPDKTGIVIFCEKLSFIERIIVLFTGKIWASELTFNKPFTPIRFEVTKKKIFEK